MPMLCVMYDRMNSAVAAGLGVVLIGLLLLVRWRWRAAKVNAQRQCTAPPPPSCQLQTERELPPVQLVHRLCPHHNVVQRYQVEEKDSLDEHLDVLTRKLAEKEGRLRLSKSKIRQTQYEIENLHAIDHDVRLKYREIMDSLRNDLLGNERECKKLQQQIEWVSRRRGELKDEVRLGQRLYGEAAAELASNLAELQRGRVPEHRIIDKPQMQSSYSSLRLRKEPHLPRTYHVTADLKTSPAMMQTLSGAEI